VLGLRERGPDRDRRDLLEGHGLRGVVDGNLRGVPDSQPVAAVVVAQDLDSPPLVAIRMIETFSLRMAAFSIRFRSAWEGTCSSTSVGVASVP
jgi:hypothetical protein